MIYVSFLIRNPSRSPELQDGRFQVEKISLICLEQGQKLSLILLPEHRLFKDVHVIFQVGDGLDQFFLRRYRIRDL